MHNFDGLLGLHSLFRLQNLNNSFPQLIKLLQVLITTGLTTTEAERSFSATNRIKTFLRNSMGQDRLNSLCILAVEKKFVKGIANFQDLVVEAFVKAKNRRMDFVYKNCEC